MLIFCVNILQRMLPSLSEFDYVNAPAFLNVDDVRISPSLLLFEDALEWRKYAKKITIQNYGKKAALVRILEPSSYDFTIKTSPKGKYLPSGLKTIIEVKFTFSQFNLVDTAFIPIIINGKQIDFKMKVCFTKETITITPDYLDFGSVNVGYSTVPKIVQLKNDGRRLAHFALDGKSDDFQLIVKPSKGTIDAKQTVNMYVQVMGITPGNHIREFWIRCAKPTRLRVCCNIIKPELIVYHPVKTTDFVLIKFPYTYFGAYFEKSLVVKNFNSMNAMYCVLNEWKQELHKVEDAMDIDPFMKNFSINNIEGRILPHEGLIFCFR